MTITAKIIADSINASGNRLTTLELRYPRLIHAEFMTHRVFSRNASSSRAIPVTRLIQDILDDTAMPMHWGKNQRGMQAREEHSASVVFASKNNPGVFHHIPPIDAWLVARNRAIEIARGFDEAGYHKQIVNRLLEPFSHINVVVSATEWDNFFLLRDHPDAQPEIQMLAQQIKLAMAGSTPRLLQPGEWHLPYVPTLPSGEYSGEVALLKKSSASRCARVSYKTHDGRIPKLIEDLELFNKLAGSNPRHLSPVEHQATPGPSNTNFKGWTQFREALEV
jgi:hypothetical protein